jgi:hypothetical protein
LPVTQTKPKALGVNPRRTMEQIIEHNDYKG